MADETAEELGPAARRLCNEIQLFDLCDLDSCRFKSSRFCTNEELLAKFEAIKEEDERSAIPYEDEEGDEEIDTESEFDDCDDYFDEGDENC